MNPTEYELDHLPEIEEQLAEIEAAAAVADAVDGQGAPAPDAANGQAAAAATVSTETILRQEALRNLAAVASMRGHTLDLTGNAEYNKKAAAYLQKHLGSKLTAYLLGMTTRRLGKMVRGVEPFDRSRARILTEVLEITRILQSAMSDKAARLWWVTENDYLGYFIPMDELLEDPSWVRSAALTLVAF